MTDKAYLKYIRSQGVYDFSDKPDCIDNHIAYMLMRTQSMFEWHGLPETIPQKYLETYIQVYGFACVAEDKGNLYAFFGGLGGEPDEYYNPTICVVANPYLQLSKEYRINKDCAIIRNDSYYMGLIPMFKKYSTMLTENELSLFMAEINTRVSFILSASDDSTKEAAQKFLDDLIKGRLGVVGDNPFLEDLRSIPTSTTNTTNILGDLIETEQYLKASWFNELGLNANYNMKREALNTAESSINNDILFPLVDHMLKERQLGAAKVNEIFGTDITVELSSSWQDNKEEEEETIESINGDPETETKQEEEEKEKEEVNEE